MQTKNIKHIKYTHNISHIHTTGTNCIVTSVNYSTIYIYINIYD